MRGKSQLLSVFVLLQREKNLPLSVLRLLQSETVRLHSDKAKH